MNATEPDRESLGHNLEVYAGCQQHGCRLTAEQGAASMNHSNIISWADGGDRVSLKFAYPADPESLPAT